MAVLCTKVVLEVLAWPSVVDSLPSSRRQLTGGQRTNDFLLCRAFNCPLKLSREVSRAGPLDGSTSSITAYSKAWLISEAIRCALDASPNERDQRTTSARRLPEFIPVKRTELRATRTDVGGAKCFSLTREQRLVLESVRSRRHLRNQPCACSARKGARFARRATATARPNSTAVDTEDGHSTCKFCRASRASMPCTLADPRQKKGITMPIRCAFDLNGKTTSTLNCPGFGMVPAFSGKDSGRDNPNATGIEGVGPIPKGTYYILDRQSGGHAGWLYDAWGKYGWGTTDHTKWFALWNASTGDSTYVGKVKRGHFRLHPMGPRRLSEGCITVTNPTTFDRLADFLRSSGADLPVPGSSFKAYGTVEVK